MCALWLLVCIYMSGSYRWELTLVRWGRFELGAGYEKLFLGWLFIGVLTAGAVMATRAFIGKPPVPETGVGRRIAKAAMPRWLVVTLSLVVGLIAIVAAQWLVRCAMGGRC